MAVSTIDPNGLNIGQIGGRRNALINPSFSVAQRGSSGTLSGSSLTYVSDRWVHRAASAVGGTTTYAQDVANGATQLVLTYSGATSHAYIQQMIEAQNIYHLWGNEITISLYTTASNPTIRMYSYDASDTEETLLSDTALTSQGNNRWTHTMTLTTPSGGFKEGNGRALLVVFGINGLSTVADGTYKFWNTQMELGSVPTPFEHRSYGEELSACQRYYWKSFNYDTVPADNISVANNIHCDGYHAWTAYSTTGIRTPYISHPVAMRSAPTITIYSSGRANTSGKAAIYTGTWGAVTSNYTVQNENRFAFGGTASGLTAYSSYLFGGGWACDAEL